MKKLLFLIFLLADVPRLYAQTSPTFDSTWASQFQTALDNTVYNSDIVGASAAVLVPGQGLWLGTSGESYESDPITSDMRFGIGSNTKLFTSALLLKSQEQGILSLDDHLGKWLSAYPYIDTSATIRQALMHQTGFFDFFNDNFALVDSCFVNPDEFWTPDEVLASIGPPHFNVGDAYSYSNTNYLLAGLVVEAATGQTYEQDLHQYILDPLSMDSTFIGAFETPNGPVAHEWSQGVDLGDTPNVAFYSMAKALGNIYSTPQEIVEWYHHLFSGDVISETSLQQLLDFEPASNYGLGIIDGENPYPLNYVFYFHNGGTLGYATMIGYDKSSGSVIAVFTNGGAGDFSFFYSLLGVFYYHYPKKQNDAGITSILSPEASTCSSTILPIVTLKNFGSGILTSADINYHIDSGDVNTYSWSGTLDTGSSVNISLPDLIVENGTHSFQCFTNNPNGTTEGYTFNDTTYSSFIIDLSSVEIAPMNEDFSGTAFPPQGWIATNDVNLTWQKTSLLPALNRPAAVKNNYFDWNIGHYYDLYLPMLDLSALSSPQFSFDFAYGPYPGYSDTLQVMISSDCDSTYQMLLDNYGDNLETASATYGPYFPADDDWVHETISLNGFSGEVLIKFRDITGFSNNLWLDNITVDEATGIETANAENPVDVFPNPFSSSTTILFNQYLNDATLILYNAAGKEVNRINGIDAHSIELQREGLSSGIYFFNLIQKGMAIRNGMVVVE